MSAANRSAASVDLSALLLPVAGELLVVPSELVVEIIRVRPLERPEQAPQWLLGEFAWHGDRLRVLSFDALNSNGKPSEQVGSRLVILRMVESSERAQRNYAILTHGVPHLMRLVPDSLTRVQSALLGPAERMKVNIFGQDGSIPDLDYLERHALMPL